MSFMNISLIANDIKRAILEMEGCSTDTTPKKGDGFVPYNRFGLKWGQVDVDEKSIRIVLDLFPGRYSLEELSSQLYIPLKAKGRRGKGMYMKTTDKTAPHFDALVILLTQDYCDSFGKQEFPALLGFIKKAAEESHFKSKATSR
jgi:hypothetical protein